MKKLFNKFFSNIFSDYEVMYAPHADAKNIMYAYISMPVEPTPAVSDKKLTPPANFTEYKNKYKNNSRKVL